MSDQEKLAKVQELVRASVQMTKKVNTTNRLKTAAKREQRAAQGVLAIVLGRRPTAAEIEEVLS